MEKLESKQVQFYLSKNLKVLYKTTFNDLEHKSIEPLTPHNIIEVVGSGKYQLILKPLSDLFIKRFDDENGGLRHIDIISRDIFFDNHVDQVTSHENFWHGLINSMVYPTLNQSKQLFDFLYSHHYDVEALFSNGNGLIKKGLAVNEETAKKI